MTTLLVIPSNDVRAMRGVVRGGMGTLLFVPSSDVSWGA